MNSLLNNQDLTLFCLIIAVFRIYLEVIAFDFKKLPITGKLDQEKAQSIHKMGFYFAVGYFVLWAPTYF